MDELKNNDAARTIFDSSILAELKNRDERLAPISNFEGFEREFGKILPTLTRIEGKLDAVADTGQETKDIVERIERMLVERSGEQPTPEQLDELRRQLAQRDQQFALKDEEIQQWVERFSELKRDLATRTASDGEAERKEASEKLRDYDISGAGEALDRLIERQDHQARKQAENQAATLNERAQIHELQFEWDQAIATRERAVAICPGDTDLRSVLARALTKQNRFDAAIDHYEFLLEHPMEEPSRASYLNNLAGLYKSTSRLDQAEKACDESLNIQRDLARINPDTYRSDVAVTLNNLAILYRATGRLGRAENAYREALDIQLNLARDNSDAYRPHVAITLNNLAIHFSETDRLDLAETTYDETLEIRRDLACVDPDAYLPDVATTLNNLAVLYRATHRLDLLTCPH